MYKREMEARIAKLKEKIKNRDEQIASMIAANNADKLRLERLKLSLEAKISEEELNRAKAKPNSPKRGRDVQVYRSLSDCESVGLYNKTVLFPVAKCKLHNCYLDYGDVHKRRCAIRMCKHMEWFFDKKPE